MKQIKRIIKYIKQEFSIIGHETGQESLSNEKKIRRSPNYPSLLLREHFQSTEKGREIYQSLAVSLSWGKIAGRPRSIEFKRQSIRHKRAAQRENSEICSGFPSSLQLKTDQHMHVGNIYKTGQDTPEIIRGNNPRACTRLGKFSGPISRSGKPINSQDIR